MKRGVRSQAEPRWTASIVRAFISIYPWRAFAFGFWGYVVVWVFPGTSRKSVVVGWFVGATRCAAGRAWALNASTGPSAWSSQLRRFASVYRVVQNLIRQPKDTCHDQAE